MNVPAYKMIETQTELEAFAKTLKREQQIAVDLEADSMYHFKEKVCLIQMATCQANVLIDPLQVPDLSCLAPIFDDPNIQKVFHGSDYDIRSLHRDFNINVNNLFDTQLACRFLGIQSTGLEAVLQKRFNIRLDKKYQKKDWSQRPLPLEMLKYASRDAVYLIPLAKMLQKELRQKDRIRWVDEECTYLSNVRSTIDENEPLYLRFKGAGRMKPRNLAILEKLLCFRRKIARQKDRPLFKILGNDALIKITMARPSNLRRLDQLRVLSQRQVNMYGPAVIKQIQAAIKIPEDQLPKYPRKKAPVLSPKVPERVKTLKKWRDKQARILGMDPSLICNKAVLTAIAANTPCSIQDFDAIEDMKEWQKKVFSKEILKVLEKA